MSKKLGKQPAKHAPKSKPAKKRVEKEIRLSLVGVSYRVPPATRKFLLGHLPCRVVLAREKDNLQDENAISVAIEDKGVPYNGMKLGYLRRQVAAVWANEIDAGRLTISKAYLIELDAVEGVGELLITVKAFSKALEIGP